MFAGLPAVRPRYTFECIVLLSGLNIYYRSRHIGHSTNRLLSFTALRDCPCASVFDNPHLYRLFHDCLRRIALRAAS